MSTIICAIDLSPSAPPVAGVAAALARALGCRLELLHVVHTPPALPPEMLTDALMEGLRAEASQFLEQMATDMRGQGVDAAAFVSVNLLEDGITRRARQIGAELIVIGT